MSNAHAHTWQFQFARKIEVTVLSWRCQECASTKVTQLLPRRTPETLSIPPKTFVGLLAEGKRFDERYENLSQTQWLLANWSIDDGHAYYLLLR